MSIYEYRGDLCLGCCISRINLVPNDNKICDRCLEPICIKCSVLPTIGCKHCALIYCDRCQGPLDLGTCYVCLCCHDDAMICENCMVSWCTVCKYATCKKCEGAKCSCQKEF